MWPLILLVATALVTSSVASQKETGSQPGKLDCAHLDYMKKGRPVFVGANDGVRWGISAPKETVILGEPIIVDIWIDNRTDKPILAGGRCTNLHSGDVFDHSGHLMIGRHEKKHDLERLEVCSATDVIIEIPAHTCREPVDAQGSNFTLDYNLAPGVYYVFPTRGTDPSLFKQGLMITVREQ